MDRRALLPRRWRKGRILSIRQVMVLCVLAAPAYAQYAGPAILSRGDAPSAMLETQVSFRPFFEVSSIYDTGLAGVSVNSQGQLGTTSAAGIQIAGGISGSHAWRHTTIGLDYRGDINHYDKKTYYDGSDQNLMLEIRHQFSRHISLVLRETAGMFDRNYGLGLMQQSVAYDPSQTTLPTTDFFDNRTLYANTQADLVYQRTARLSFDFGGDGYVTSRRSAALNGLTGFTARGDMQYRVTRRTTIGAAYRFEQYGFTRVFSSNDLHSFNGTFATRLSKSLEFSGYAGVTRAETKFVQTVPVDPAIAALLGIVNAQQVVYGIRYIPNVSVRFSRAVHNGLFYVDAGRQITPGNGLFLTSDTTNAGGGYTYTGLRRWSFSVYGSYNRATSLGNIAGQYGGEGGWLTASRQLARNFHMLVGFTGTRYFSATYEQYNRPIYAVRVGFGWAPGDLPLRVW
jgi:hypothetical protein